MNECSFKYWKDEGHILVSSGNGDCFLDNSALNPMINWLNLHQQDILSGTPIESNTANGVQCLSVGGNLAIRTERDFVLLNKENLSKFVLWLNNHRTILSIHEVWP